MSEKFSLAKRIQSFSFALNGLKILLKEEHNARIHLMAGLAAVLAAFYFDISPLEWMAITGCIAFVFALELVNSSIERLADLVSVEEHPVIKQVKDMAAAAVLMAAIASVVVAAFIFLPRIIML